MVLIDQVLDDVVISRPQAARAGTSFRVARRGLSVGSWQGEQQAPSWKLICTGSLHVKAEVMAFTGGTETAYIEYKNVVQMKRTTAVDYRDRPLYDADRLAVYLRSGPAVAFSMHSAYADYIEAAFGYWNALPDPDAQERVRVAKAGVVDSWNTFLDLLLGPTLNPIDVESIYGQAVDKLQEDIWPELEAVVVRVKRAAEMRMMG